MLGIIALLVTPFIIGLTKPIKAVNKQVDVNGRWTFSSYIQNCPQAETRPAVAGVAATVRDARNKGQSAKNCDDAVHSTKAVIKNPIRSWRMGIPTLLAHGCKVAIRIFELW